MNIHKLRTILDAGSYSSDPQVAASELNRPTIQSVGSGTTSELDLLKAFAGEPQTTAVDGDQFLQKLEAEALTNSLVARMVRWLQSSGLEIGDPLVRQVINSLRQDGKITLKEARIALAIGSRRISVVEQEGIGRVSARHVVKARAL